MTKDEIIDFDQLYENMTRRKRGVMWKPSVMSYILNAEERTHKMAEKLADGTWQDGKPRPVKITTPKPREGSSIPFQDRVYQGSLVDNELYPALTRSFVYDNAANQKGKGNDFALQRMRKFIWNFYTHYGTDGYIVQADIKGYYPNMQHRVAEAKLARHVVAGALELSVRTLRAQYPGEVGYPPGSPIIQMVGVAVLDPVDHHAKERLHIRYYIRVMDDFWMLAHDRAEGERWLEELAGKVGELGFELSPKKSHVRPMTKPFEFLGFRVQITETGKVLMVPKKSNIKAGRRKEWRMVAKAKRGEITRETVSSTHQGRMAHISDGTSKALIQREERRYNNLWRDPKCGTKRQG